MIIKQTSINYRVPNWDYCNFNRNKPTPHNRCRFCTETKRGCFTCVLHNVPLKVTGGLMIEKAPRCLNNMPYLSDIAKMTPEVSSDDIITSSINAYRKIYKNLISQGLTGTAAHKAALGEVKRCQELI